MVISLMLILVALVGCPPQAAQAVDNDSDFQYCWQDGYLRIYRLKVPGGWIVIARQIESGGVTSQIVSDTNYAWIAR